MKEYHIFISHAWRYSEDYYKLEKLLNEIPNFKWKNYSVPQHDPVIDPNSKEGKNKLKKELEEQIRPVHIVIVLAGMYVNYREWIQTEINIALKYKKPIIGIKPRGHQRIPKQIQDVACDIVGWNKKSIEKAIKKCVNTQ